MDNLENPMPYVWGEPPAPPAPQGPLRIGLAIGALVLGVVGVAASVILTGALFGLIGLILALACLIGRHHGRAMAGWGLALSLAGILASCVFALAYVAAYQHKEGRLRPPLAGRVHENTAAEAKDPWTHWLGRPAPDLVLTDVQGQRLQLADLKGRRVFLHFWNPDSLLSRDAVPHLTRLRRERPESELVVVAISRWCRPDTVKGAGKLLGINYPLTAVGAEDDDLPEPFDKVYATPVTFVIDAAGLIERVLTDYHDWELLSAHANGPSRAPQADDHNRSEKSG